MTKTIDLGALAVELGPIFAEGTAERDTSGTFVSDHYKILKERKVFSALVPEDLGGGGSSHRDMCNFLRIIAQSCGSTALALSMHQHLVAAAVYNHRNGRPGQALLEKVASGELTLISTGANDWLDSSGVCRRVDGGFRVTAKKPFASGSPAGDLFVTTAPYEDPEEGWQVLHFVLPVNADGVSLAGDWDTLGMRATGSETAVFEEAFIPDEAVALRRPREGYHPAFNVVIAVAMPLIMSAYLGVAEAAAERAKGVAAKRAEDPTTPFLLGELINEVTLAQVLVQSMIDICDDYAFQMDVETANAVLIRKTLAADAIIGTTEKALKATGGAGFYRKLGLEQLLRDAHGAQFHPLPAKRQHHFTGQLALGLAPIVEGTAKRMRVAA
jgi:alkylation response protein AidB-like acyl-CoA dehydrogenase